MSLFPAKTCAEGVFQYCNYGYDRSKYSSAQDCHTRKLAEDCPGENPFLSWTTPTKGAQQSKWSNLLPDSIEGRIALVTLIVLAVAYFIFRAK